VILWVTHGVTTYKTTVYIRNIIHNKPSVKEDSNMLNNADCEINPIGN
jgi:hypothetical protein